jgi:hypothetical protein
LKQSIKTFHDAITEMKQTITIFEQCQLQRLNTTSDSAPTTAEALVLLDLGLVPNGNASVGGCYDRDGLYFHLEAYKSHTVEGSSSAVHSGQPANAGPSLKRFRQSGGVIASGGRFDQLIATNSLRYHDVVPSEPSELVVACGVKFRLDALTALVSKSLDALNATLNATVKSGKQQQVELKQRIQPPYPLSNTSPDVLILEAQTAGSSSDLHGLLSSVRGVGLHGVDYVHQLQGLHDYFEQMQSNNTQSNTSSASATAITVTGSSAAASGDDLIRFSSPTLMPVTLTASEAMTLCVDFGIPLLVLVAPKSTSNSTSSCQIHYLGDGKPGRAEVSVEACAPYIVRTLLSKCPERLLRNVELCAIVSKMLSLNGNSDDSKIESSRLVTDVNKTSSNQGGTAPGKAGSKQDAAESLQATIKKMRDVVLIIIDSSMPSRSFGIKEPDSRKQSKQRTQQCERDVAEYMKQLLQCSTIQLIQRTHGQGMLYRPYASGTSFVISAEISYLLLREFATIMMRACSFITSNIKSTNLVAARDELQRINLLVQESGSSSTTPGSNAGSGSGSTTSGSALKKLLRQIVFELTSFPASSGQPTSVPEKETGIGSFGGVGSGSGGHGHNNAPTPVVNSSGVPLTIYLHSIPDNRFDIVQFVPESLAKVALATPNW